MIAKLHAMFGCSVRTKLALGFLVVGLLPLAVFAAVTLQATKQSLSEHTATEMRERGDALQAALASRGRAVRDQAVSYGVWDATAAAMDRRDRAWLEDNATIWVVENSEMTGAQALTLDGEVISAAGDFEDVSLYDSPVVAAAGKAGATGFDFRMIDGRLFIIAAGPIIDEAEENTPSHGIVVYGELVDEAVLAELASIIGVSELHVHEGSRVQAASVGSAARAMPADMEVGTLATTGADSVLLTDLRDRAGQLQATLALRVNADATLLASQAIWSAATYSLFAALAIALLAGFLVARMLSKPLLRLADAARAIAAGGAGQQVIPESRDEFGEVASAFNFMSDELHKAFAELRERGDTDGLTGLLNYRAMYQALEGEVARGRRYGTPFSLLILDVDDLKLLNDAHGHPAGDGLLKQVSRLLREHSRQADIVGRVGGDEFMIVLPETRSEAAYLVARKLRDVISATPYVTPDGQEIPVRVCIGASSFPEDGSDLNSLVARADMSLYDCKGHGGNAITRWEPEGQQGESSSVTFGMLESLVAAVDNKDRYTARHSADVTEYATMIATALGFLEEDLRTVRVAGLLHDVGKIGVPGRILRKPGRLTPDEMEIMRRHPQLGGLLIQEIPDCAEVRAAVVSHHERFDGTGYPHGLAGEAIPLVGRILAVADALSAMTSDRPYRSGMALEQASSELRAGAGTQFDPLLVDLLIDALSERVAGEDRASHSVAVRD